MAVLLVLVTVIAIVCSSAGSASGEEWVRGYVDACTSGDSGDSLIQMMIHVCACDYSDTDSLDILWLYWTDSFYKGDIDSSTGHSGRAV
jgi:hypothetical protein